tara:strand:- start:209 stop:700 length:492 start_codon:yes stop_codon:yes gene_type:complete
MKIIDNFLSEEYFRPIQSLMMGEDFPWYFNNYTVSPGGSGYQFTHTFLSGTGNGSYSDFSPMLQPIVDKLKVKRLIRIKANLNPQTFIFNRSTGWHVDYPRPLPEHKSAIYYVNTNNGYTQFKWRKKVKSVENRIVIADVTREHSGFTCTDKKSRVIINFNYI